MTQEQRDLRLIQDMELVIAGYAHDVLELGCTCGPQENTHGKSCTGLMLWKRSQAVMRRANRRLARSLGPSDKARPEARQTPAITLSRHDSEALVDAMENPPEPNDALRRLFKKIYP